MKAFKFFTILLIISAVFYFKPTKVMALDQCGISASITDITEAVAAADTYEYSVSVVVNESGLGDSDSYVVRSSPGNHISTGSKSIGEDLDTTTTLSFSGTVSEKIYIADADNKDTPICSTTLTFSPDTITQPVQLSDPSLQDSLLKDINTDLCEQAGPLRTQCQQCNGLWTAFGCIPTGGGENMAENVTKNLFQVGIGVAGGIALVLILFGAFLTTTSGGDPERLKKGKETIVSAIIGLIFIILSAVLLQFIGVELLQLPDF